MNRPERRNALSGEMLTAMGQALAQCEADPDVAVVVLTGAGGAFCAGGDVKGMASGTGGGSTARAGADIDSRIHAQRISQRATAGKLYRMPKPTIAALPGAAAGAGLSLALACDLRIAAENAVLTTAFARVGFSGDYGGTYFLTQLVGSAKARELYYLSDRVDAKEALRLGLVNWVVPANALEAETMKLAQRLARGARVAYRYMKENLNRAATGVEAEECLDLEATHHVHTGLTEDHREAAKAFVEKREPVFKGR
jgi:2-(1,2-epoxy-1,2-dihydrophenyl)acetyl-CoA isomerase